MQCFQQTAVDDHLKRLTPALWNVLSNAVKDHDGVLHREANHRQDRGQEERIHFPAGDQSHQRHKAGGHENVMQHGGNGAHAVAPGIGNLAERNDNEQQDDHSRSHSSDRCGPRHLATHGGAHGLEPQFIGRPELVVQFRRNFYLLGRIDRFGAYQGSTAIGRRLNRCVTVTPIHEYLSHIGRRHGIVEPQLKQRSASEIHAQP